LVATVDEDAADRHSSIDLVTEVKGNYRPALTC
jgi:hypothetical protein